jgi:hypothetical protein
MRGQVTGLSFAELQGTFVAETSLVSCAIVSIDHPNLNRQTLADEIDMTLRHSKRPITLLLVGLLAYANAQSADAADALTREAQAAITPGKALAMLRQGNERFVGGNITNRDYAAQVKQTARGQFRSPPSSAASTLASRLRSCSIEALATCSSLAWPATSSTTTRSAAWSSQPSSPAPS